MGSLLPIMLLRWWQQAGHKPIVLMGGGTTKVGDPSGKDESRQLLSEERIAANMDGIKRVFSQFLAFGDGPTDALMMNNADWLDGLSYIPFLRDYGRHFSVNRMMGFDSVRLRLDREQPLSFLEFKLHGAPGLRLSGAEPAHRLHPADGAGPTSGAISSRVSSWRGAPTRPPSTA